METHRKLVKYLQNALKWTIRRWDLAMLFVVLLLVLAAEGPLPGELDTHINRLLVGEQFDFVSWEIKAMLNKLTHILVSPQRYMDEQSRHDFFLDYLVLVSDIQQAEWEIHRTYTDPEIKDPEAATTALRDQLYQLRESEEIRQPLAEAIVEEQVSFVLVSEGFGMLGQELPPVSIHFTPLPALLIVSPRDRIERTFSLGLRHGLDANQREAIEKQVDTFQDVSSLVTNIGGLSAYPAMLLESSSLNWVVDVTAHEWMHHYLTLLPLGWNYAAGPETRTINETVASIVGEEAGRLTVAHYYPEFLPPEPEPVLEKSAEQAPPPEPPAFDYRAEMRETRIRVDELLKEGKIEEAEDYMEERRQEFVAQGYYIRKLNQAYFAFHGAYADQPGAAGADPIGPAVRDLRANSPDLHTFVARIARITTLAELEAMLEEQVFSPSLHSRRIWHCKPPCAHPLHRDQRE
ncbi:MAG: hypothetical protein GY832_05700 [Chloroflexi bacterium]|nr:hypothetical protein [Chloroflexota bacterium]